MLSQQVSADYRGSLEWNIFEHPPAKRGVINLHAALLRHSLELTIADRIREVPAHTPQDHLAFKWLPLNSIVAHHPTETPG